MNRLTEKVRDIVEVRASANIRDFLADPFATVEAYHFTDITSDLMAKWIDRVSSAKKGSGDALALAGFRGVGKSHFLAVLGALLAQPECRGRVEDPHVGIAVQRLSRRPGVVAYVRRGSEKSLVDELNTAIAEATKTKSGELGRSINELLMRASARSLDLPLIVLIDTASDRTARVNRDDGPVLSEIAESAKQNGVFLGLALDDDIAGADGMNSSIASNFTIDYLDQEHLFKIVNAYLFAKREQMRPLLHDIYDTYRAAFPAFSWSEHRFLSIYPLHPALLDIAPFIRLYLQDFALLGFASEAGLKILGRPANSLIGLDEVFDAIEQRLKSNRELADALQTLETVDREVIARMPLMKRLTAKLVLKGLFLLSLRDEPASAEEIRASMLMEAEPAEEIAAMLQNFAKHAPGIDEIAADGQVRFAFALGKQDDLRSALAVTPQISPEDMTAILERQFSEKFADLKMDEGSGTLPVQCTVAWRGSLRRGTLRWFAQQDEGKGLDWSLEIGTASELANVGSANSKFYWLIADMTPAEMQTLSRYHHLQTDPEIREKYRDSLPSALHAHSIAVEKLWQRIFLDDAVLRGGDREYRLSPESFASPSFTDAAAALLAPLFEAAYPNHPRFARTLEENDALLLTGHLFGNAETGGPEVESIVTGLALPLGLVRESDGVVFPLSEDELLELPLVKNTVLTVVEKDGKLSMGDLVSSMSATPYGLTRETRQLVLSALVAQRHFEFVTSSGNRIHYRSLDLQIDWDDITGIARPSAQEYTNERLVVWAASLTGDNSLRKDKSSESRSNVIASLTRWMTEWNCNAVIPRFDELPDEMLNGSFWRLAAGVRKSFGAVADSIDDLIKERGSLENCLQNIADTFGDSESEFKNRISELARLQETLDTLPELRRARDYVLQSELTGNEPTDRLRRELIRSLSVLAPSGTAPMKELVEKAAAFKATYKAVYVERHASAMTEDGVSARLNEFLASDMWALFTSVALLPVFDSDDMDAAMRLIRTARSTTCKADVSAVLDTHPICTCGFSLFHGSDPIALIGRLSTIVASSLKRVSQLFTANRSVLAACVEGDLLDAFEDAINGRRSVPKLSASEIMSLRTAAADLSVSHYSSQDAPFASLSDLLLENELDRIGLRSQ
jgi:hypothetical protein